MSEVDKNMPLLMDVRTMNCLYDRRFILTPFLPNTGNIFFDLPNSYTFLGLVLFLVIHCMRNQNDISTFFCSSNQRSSNCLKFYSPQTPIRFNHLLQVFPNSYLHLEKWLPECQKAVGISSWYPFEVERYKDK